MGRAYRKVAPQNSWAKDFPRRTPPPLAETHQPGRIADIFRKAYQAETQKLEIRQTPLQLSFSGFIHLVFAENHSFTARTTHGQRVISKVQEEPCQQERKVRGLADTERVPAKLSPAQCAAEKAGPCAPVKAAKAGGSRAANRRSQSAYQKHEKKAQRFLRRGPRKQLNDRGVARARAYLSEPARSCSNAVVCPLGHPVQTLSSCSRFLPDHHCILHLSKQIAHGRR